MSAVRDLLENYCTLQGIELKNFDDVVNALDEAIDNLIPTVVEDHGILKDDDDDDDDDDEE